MSLISLKLPFPKVAPKIGPMRKMINGFNPKVHTGFIGKELR